MNPLRQLLKQSIAVPHERLESLKVMKDYSSGLASFTQYVAVTKSLHCFWSHHHPSTDRLPHHFHQFYGSYISALQTDVGACPETKTKTAVNEIAFFYVLLGSGLGAQIIYKRNRNNALPQKNIEHLAENSGQLWKQFNAEYLNDVPDSEHSSVAKDAQTLFTTLFHRIDTI